MKRWTRMAILCALIAAVCHISPANAAISNGSYVTEASAINVVNHFPSNMSVGISPETPLTVEFGGALNQSFYQNVSFNLFNGTEPVNGELFYNPAARQVMFKAAQPLAQGQTYTAQVSYYDGLGRTSEKVWSFQTANLGDTSALSANSANTSAVNNAQNSSAQVSSNAEQKVNSKNLTLTNASMGSGSIRPDASMEVSFSEPLDVKSLKSAPIQLFENNRQIGIDYRLSKDMKTVTISPRASLKNNASYAVAIDKTIASSSGKKLAKKTLIPFKVSDTTETASANLSNTVQNLQQNAQNNLQTLQQNSMNTFQNTQQNVQGMYQNAQNSYQNVQQNTMNSYQNAQSAFQNVQQNAMNSYQNIQQNAQAAYQNSIQNPFDAVQNAQNLYQSAQQNVNSNYQSAQNAFQNAQNSFEGIQQNAQTAYQNVQQNAQNTYKAAIENPFERQTSAAFTPNQSSYSSNQMTVARASMQQQQQQAPVEQVQLIGLAPQNGSKVTNLAQPITIGFSEEIKAETLNEFTFRLEDDFGPVPAKIHYFQGRKQATLTPVGLLDAEKNYRIIVTQGITDLYGRPIKSGINSMFATTASNAAPAMPVMQTMTAQVSPQREAQELESFDNQPVNNSVRASVSYQQNQMQQNSYNQLQNSNPFANSNGQNVAYNSNSMMAGADKTVRTSAKAEALNSFKVASVYPGMNSDNIARKAKIAVHFTEVCDPKTVNNINISVFANQTRVDGKVTYDRKNNRAIFEPSRPLEAKTEHKVIVSDKILSKTGEPLAQRLSWSFTTTSDTRNQYVPAAAKTRSEEKCWQTS